MEVDLVPFTRDAICKSFTTYTGVPLPTQGTITFNLCWVFGDKKRRGRKAEVAV